MGDIQKSTTPSAQQTPSTPVVVTREAPPANPYVERSDRATVEATGRY